MHGHVDGIAHAGTTHGSNGTVARLLGGDRGGVQVRYQTVRYDTVQVAGTAADAGADATQEGGARVVDPCKFPRFSGMCRPMPNHAEPCRD